MDEKKDGQIYRKYDSLRKRNITVTIGVKQSGDASEMTDKKNGTRPEEEKNIFPEDYGPVRENTQETVYFEDIQREGYKSDQCKDSAVESMPKTKKELKKAKRAKRKKARKKMFRAYYIKLMKRAAEKHNAEKSREQEKYKSIRQKSAAKEGKISGGNFLDLSPFKRTIFILWKNKFRYIALLAAVAVILSSFFYLQSQNVYRMTISLNYEESAKGLYPNSTRLNMYEIKSEEVLKRALAYAGLEGKVRTSELAANLSVTPLVTSSVNAASSYIATSYRLVYHKSKNVGNISSRDMLNLICKAYSEIFHEYYTDNYSILRSDLDNLDHTEYLVIGDYIEIKANILSRYLGMRADASKAYSDEETGETFKSLRKRVSNFIDYDITNYKSYVLESGLSKNKAHYTGVLSYKNVLLNVDYDKNMASYNANRSGIKMYNAAMSAVVMIPTKYDNAGQINYYMSRTNAEYDYLADNAKWNLKDATDVLKEIEENENVMDKISSLTASAAQRNKADKMIEDMKETLVSLAGEIETTDKAYIHYKTKDYLTFTENAATKPDKFGIKKTTLVCAGAAVLICVNVYIKQKNKSKKEEKIY